MKQGANISWSKGIDIVHSLFSYHWGFMLEIHMKRYLKIARTFSSVVPHSFLNQEQHGTDYSLNFSEKKANPANTLILGSAT